MRLYLLTKHTRLNHKLITKVLISFIFLSLSVLLLGCQTNDLPNPTRSYYINDFAGVLTDATLINITNEGTRLFNDTNSYVHGGTELVVSTFLIDDISEVENFKSADLFHHWNIGQGKMGLLILIFFEKNGNLIELVDTQIEIGTRLGQFITRSQLELIVEQTLYHATWDEDDYIDLPIMHMYYELLEAIYMRVYDYVSFTYDLRVYELYIQSYQSDKEPSRLSMSTTKYVLFQIGVDNELFLISLSMFTVLFISLSYYVIRKDRNLTILKRRKKDLN